MLQTLHIDPSLSKEGNTYTHTHAHPHTHTHTQIDMHCVSRLGRKRKCHLGPTRRQAISKNLWHDYRFPEELQPQCKCVCVCVCVCKREWEQNDWTKQKQTKSESWRKEKCVKEKIDGCKKRPLIFATRLQQHSCEDARVKDLSLTCEWNASVCVRQLRAIIIRGWVWG